MISFICSQNYAGEHDDLMHKFKTAYTYIDPHSRQKYMVGSLSTALFYGLKPKKNKRKCEREKEKPAPL